MGAVMVLAMHAGFAFLELGTVRKKNQVNALVMDLTSINFSRKPFAGGFLVAEPQVTDCARSRLSVSGKMNRRRDRRLNDRPRHASCV